MIKTLIIVSLIISISLLFIHWYGLSTPTQDQNNRTINPNSKPVILLVIDSLMDEPLQKTIHDGKAPGLEFLMKNGHYEPQIVSSYPTMSVTIDSTLLSGTYPDKHKVPGLVWFNEGEKRLINYGSGKGEVVKLGLKQVLQDGLFNLNENHLSKNVETIYEQLSELQEDSASINGLLYRGNNNHTLNIPKLASAINLLPENPEVNGPTLLSMGILSKLNQENQKHDNIWQGMGFNDSFSANELQYLVKNRKLPSFTLSYFPDLDHQVHKNGLMDLKGIEKMDQQIQTVLNSYDSWEKAAQQAIWIVYGDSAQSTIKANRNEAIIDLTSLNKNYRVPELGEPIKKGDEMILSVNERMAYINLLDENISYSEVASYLQKDSRIGFTAWKENGNNHVLAAESEEKLIFRPNGNFLDQYEQSWDISGNLNALDLSVNDQNEVKYGSYPDALARLYGALHSHQGRYIVVDAKPGFEFVGQRSPTHLGGAGHGSLHRKDSLSPLIIVGTDKRPKHNRVVDFKEWIFQLIK
ncbi:alkaline phosphatase family protein [Halobacillus seohaensis]|uniref:Alkaline phosphatase family protein n=1 Tax=Halobacillus seohaensis TaxID=447421 RepID=A0ABW2EHP4_9BACI